MWNNVELCQPAHNFANKHQAVCNNTNQHQPILTSADSLGQFLAIPATIPISHGSFSYQHQHIPGPTQSEWHRPPQWNHTEPTTHYPHLDQSHPVNIVMHQTCTRHWWHDLTFFRL